MRLKDKGDVTPIQIGEIINKDKRTVQRVLKKLGDNNLIEWFGTSIKDPKKFIELKINFFFCRTFVAPLSHR